MQDSLEGGGCRNDRRALVAIAVVAVTRRLALIATHFAYV
jgi:hypothetical protein